MKINPIKQVIIKACTNKSFRAYLISDPKKALAEEGIDVPVNIDVVIHEENQDDKILIVLPVHDATGLKQQPRHLPDGAVVNVPENLALEWNAGNLIAKGRIDSSTAPVLKRELLRAMDDVDLDMSKVIYLSSAGLSALLSGLKHLNDMGYELRLVKVPDIILNVLDIAGFSQMFEIIDYNTYFDPLMMSGL